MELVQLDPHGRLYLSPAIDNWEPIHQVGISAIIDLDGEIDHGIPTVPNQVLYIYFPFLTTISRIFRQPGQSGSGRARSD